MDFSQLDANDLSQYTLDSPQEQSSMMTADDDLQLEAFRDSLQGGDLDSRLSNIMLTYDSLPTPMQQMTMSLDPPSTFAYDIAATYTPSSTGVDTSLDQARVSQGMPADPRHLSLSETPVYSGRSAPVSVASNYPMPRSASNSVRGESIGRTGKSSAASGSGSGSGSGASGSTSVSRQATRPKSIQPKKLAPMGAVPESSLVKVKTESSRESAPFSNIYSSSGFDVLGILSRVAARPNPQIDIGAVDLSCAFALCDLAREDEPIVYVSDAFERLTGYTKDEIVGRNCRFLQGPDGEVQQGSKRTFVDDQTAFRLKSTISNRGEIQVSLINYRKGGQPFMNLITMIPIRWDSADFRYYVGFQVDLVEKPDAITRKNPSLSLSCLFLQTQR